jgi:hypothetical protein
MAAGGSTERELVLTRKDPFPVKPDLAVTRHTLEKEYLIWIS